MTTNDQSAFLAVGMYKQREVKDNRAVLISKITRVCHLKKTFKNSFGLTRNGKGRLFYVNALKIYTIIHVP